MKIYHYTSRPKLVFKKIEKKKKSDERIRHVVLRMGSLLIIFMFYSIKFGVFLRTICISTCAHSVKEYCTEGGIKICKRMDIFAKVYQVPVYIMYVG